MTIRINLLPHREMRRERRKKDFIGVLVLTAIAAAGVTFAVGLGINQEIDTQVARNEFIKAENAKLDEQIKEIATLREEINSLKARQNAVESLQSDRTTPVHLLDELVKQTPEGIFLKQIKQEDRRVTLVGFAQSNERVAELLRNLSSQTVWLEAPDLVESKEVPTNPNAQSKDKEGRIIYEFLMTAMIKVPSAVKPAAVPGAAPGAAASAAGAAGAAGAAAAKTSDAGAVPPLARADAAAGSKP